MPDISLLVKAQNGDRKSEELVIEENMGLVWSVVKRFAGHGYETEDLVQIGSIGLIKAVKKFNFSFGVQFSTYAVPLIIGEIKRFMRDDGVIKVSRSLKEAAANGYAAREMLYRKNGREPTIGEIALESGIGEDILIQAFDALAPPESIYTSIYDDGGREVCIADRLTADNTEDEIVDKVFIQNILDSLTARERQIIIFRYFKGKTQSEISKLIGVSQVQVSRIEKSVMERIRKDFCKA